LYCAVSYRIVLYFIVSYFGIFLNCVVIVLRSIVM